MNRSHGPAAFLVSVVLITLTPALCASDSDLPAGWLRAGDQPADYDMGVDRTGGRHGSACGFIAGRGPHAAGFGTLMQTIAADNYRGKRLRFSAYVRTAGVGDWAGLWMRIDGRVPSASRLPPVLGFDNMQKRPIKGSSGWTSYSVVLDVPPEAQWISFGILLSGPGRAWLDGLQLETVGTDVARTDVLPRQPNLRFE